MSVAPAHAVWSILVFEPATGRVGIATAGCVADVVELGELVPGVGAAASQSAFDPSIVTRAAALIKAGETPESVLADVTRTIFDTESEKRQHAAVTKDGAVTFTGSAPAGDAEDATSSGADYQVAVIGDRLAKQGAVGEIMAAFEAEVGPVALEDRLMRALETGSATGGDVDCNSRTTSQTARSAALRVAEPDDRADQPAVDLRVQAVEGGPNPLLEMRVVYDSWRDQNLAACPDCDLDALVVPPGGTVGEGQLSGVELLIGAATVALFLLIWFRRRFAGNAAGPSRSDEPKS